MRVFMHTGDQRQLFCADGQDIILEIELISLRALHAA